jgi:hypothetical protein
MMPNRKLTLKEAQAELQSYGCTPLTRKGRLNTAEWWQWPWGGAPFILPIDDDDRFDQWAFQRLLADMAKLVPRGWEFPTDPNK